MSKPMQTSTVNRDHIRFSWLPTAVIAFAAATTGTVVGFAATLSVAMPMMRQTLAAEVSGINARMASSVTPAEAACFEGASSGAVLGMATGPSTAPSNQTSGGQGTSPVTITKNIFIKKLIGGQFAHTAASITNTGPGSTNDVITTNTSETNVMNTNDVGVSTSNEQNAVSGPANVSGNTNGGSATSGAAANTSDTSLALTINNQ